MENIVLPRDWSFKNRYIRLSRQKCYAFAMFVWPRNSCARSNYPKARFPNFNLLEDYDIMQGKWVVFENYTDRK